MHIALPKDVATQKKSIFSSVCSNPKQSIARGFPFNHWSGHEKLWRCHICGQLSLDYSTPTTWNMGMPQVTHEIPIWLGEQTSSYTSYDLGYHPGTRVLTHNHIYIYISIYININIYLYIYIFFFLEIFQYIYIYFKKTAVFSFALSWSPPENPCIRGGSVGSGVGFTNPWPLGKTQASACERRKLAGKPAHMRLVI